MAKSKRKSKPRKRKPMAAPKKRRKKKSSSTSRLRRSLSARSKSTPRKRRRKKGLSDGMTKNNLVKSLKSNFGGSVGGLIKLGVDVIPIKWYWKTAIGYTGAIGSAMMGAPNVGSGIAGATTHDLGKRLLTKFGIALNDDMEDDFEDADYVDADTLRDTDLETDMGEAIVMDDDDVMYALQDDGDLRAIGDGQNYGGASMLTLSAGSNPYDLSNAYALSDPY